MAKKEKEFNKAYKEIQNFVKDYPHVELASVEQGDTGTRMVFKPRLAVLAPEDQPLSPVSGLPNDIRFKLRARANVLYRDSLLRSDLDLAKPDVVNESPHKIYSRIKSYYRSKDVFGSYIDMKADLALSGFKNDCQDTRIKEFYDNWCEDVDMEQVLEWVFQEFFTSGLVRTYKIIGKYEPQVNTLRSFPNPPAPLVPKRSEGESVAEYNKLRKLWAKGSVLDFMSTEQAERKKRWSRGYIPIAYTILNPLAIELVGPPDFNQTRVVLQPTDDMVELVRRETIKGELTSWEKSILDNMPPEFKSAIKAGKDIELDPEYVGAIDNRRMPFERYAINPMVRALEAIEYKEALREADYSTIDGITSEILVVTVGDKDNPVVDRNDLAAVSALFNTAQKAYTVVWNHTLKVERVAVENIEQIFGSKKFEQAEMDISAALRAPRALLDGIVIGGSSSKDALVLAQKALFAELNYARRQVSRWLVSEYKKVAEAYGFKQIPTIRWDTMILKDELAMKTLIMSLVDRRIISYDSAISALGFDSGFEKKILTEESKEVQAGDYGIIGSPYQRGGDSSVQETQRDPKGTPSKGRPPGDPSPKTPGPAKPENKTDYLVKKETKQRPEEKKAASIESVGEALALWGDEELEVLEKLIRMAKSIKSG